MSQEHGLGPEPVFVSWWVELWVLSLVPFSTSKWGDGSCLVISIDGVPQSGGGPGGCHSAPLLRKVPAGAPPPHPRPFPVGPSRSQSAQGQLTGSFYHDMLTPFQEPLWR